jgi:hypothetical protein
MELFMCINLVGPINSGVASGGAGVATSNFTSDVLNGKVVACYVKYNDSPPATTDVVIATSGAQCPAQSILTLTNKNASNWFYPRLVPQDILGVNLAALTVLEPVAICDKVKVAISDANNGDSVDVYLEIES